MLLSGCTDSAREATATVSPAGTQCDPPHAPSRREWRCRRAGCPLICLHHPATNHSSSSLTLTGPYLISSKLYSRFPFHQSCADLHNHRLDGVGAAPALRDRAQRSEASADRTPTRGLCFPPHPPQQRKGLPQPGTGIEKPRQAAAGQDSAAGRNAERGRQQRLPKTTVAAFEPRVAAGTHLFCK